MNVSACPAFSPFSHTFHASEPAFFTLASRYESCIIRVKCQSHTE
uniref:Uncharacterized protein n=1 Tax=Arundo donax TaxID=35708 RepID=A0A0A9HGY9_ARUDO